MYTRHELGSSRKGSIVLLNQRSGIRIQGTVGIGLNEQTRDGDQDILQGQFAVPVALEGLDANASSRWVNIGMEDRRSKIGCGRLLRVCGRDGQVKFPHAGLEGRVSWAGDEDVELGEVVGMA